MTREQVAKRVRDAVRKTSYTAVAEDMGVSVASVRNLVDYNAKPAKKILKFLGITQPEVYKLEAK